MDDALLDLLCCPETHQPLRRADATLAQRLGLEAALVREDGRVAYPVRDGIPILLAEEGLPLDAR